MGPMTHLTTTRALGSPALAGILPDLPVLIGWRWGAEQTHGTFGLLVAIALTAMTRQNYVMGWAMHVALDSISHADGGATGKGPKVWLP